MEPRERSTLPSGFPDDRLRGAFLNAFKQIRRESGGEQTIARIDGELPTGRTFDSHDAIVQAVQLLTE